MIRSKKVINKSHNKLHGLTPCAFMVINMIFKGCPHSHRCVCGCITTITAWYGNCLASDCKALRRVVRPTQYITGAKLPAIQDLYTRWCQRKALKIIKDYSHPSHRLFSLLPHGKRYRSANTLCLLSMHSHFNSTY